ncbi:MAG: methylenetetrahydrofolate reductase C-terminal domain-containing protein [Planctomycetaceae bacterium]|nr:methylenetetrahydrofolate reductase C-terminal domain-containing protein [Planctomycetaceae bacterium]
MQESTPSFLYGAEIVSSRGIPLPDETAAPLALTRSLLGDSRIAWVSITDNPGGGPMLPPDWFGGQLAEHAARIVLHLTCKDRNRIALESAAWKYAAEGFDNILALSGDLPTGGYPKFGSGVFDIDSVALIDMLTKMNAGLEIPGRKGNMEKLNPTRFFTGCAVSPFKMHENELIPQYVKMLRKIKAGAQWVLPQLGYDMRKFNELKLFLRYHGVKTPILGNVYVLGKIVAKLFHSGKLAGCVVSDSLLADIEKYASGEDKGKKYFQEFAAKQLAVFRGLGFQGGYLGGLGKPEQFFEIIELAETFSQDDWKLFYKEIQYSQSNEFHCFEEHVGTEIPDDAEPQMDLRYQLTVQCPLATKNVNLFYRFSRLVHAIAFHKNHGLYNLFAKVFRFLEKDPAEKHPNPARQGLLYKMIHYIEDDVKHTLYGCKDCGDCALPDTAYLCPMGRCSKNMRNGPCGGSSRGRCEADDKNCIWTIAYDRLKYFEEWEKTADEPVHVYDASLKGTSAWSNLYGDRT